MVAQDMLVRVADHLWQSTLVAAACGVACVLLRHHAARVRHRLWLAAILKFAVPFAALEAMGRAIPAWRATSLSPDNTFTAALYQLAAPAREAQVTTAAALGSHDGGSSAILTFAILAVWAVGFVACLARVYAGWRAVRGCLASGEVPTRGRELAVLRRLDCGESVGLVLSSGAFEPGVVGVRRPVLVWPSLLSARMSDDEIAAVMAHELEHVRRHDNLAGLGGMFVWCVFWFYPVVWWLGTRLLAERERACDEAVIARQSAKVYAESILKTCEFCLESPVVFAAGVTGADLKHRIATIMRAPARKPLSRRAAMGLGACVALLVFAPLGVGAVSARPGVSPAVGALEGSELSAQNQDETRQNGEPRFTVTSIRPSSDNEPGMAVRPMPNRGYSARKVPLIALLTSAFGVSPQRIVGVPPWPDRYDIEARYEPASPDTPLPSLNVLLQSLLRERFGLVAHMEKRDLAVYVLRVAGATTRLGPALTLSNLDCGDASAIANARLRKAIAANGAPACEAHEAPGVLKVGGMPMDLIAAALRIPAGRDVVNGTGLRGLWEASLEFAPPNDTTGNKPSVFTAVQEQLGLKLESSTAPLDVVVIDAIERPSAN